MPATLASARSCASSPARRARRMSPDPAANRGRRDRPRHHREMDEPGRVVATLRQQRMINWMNRHHGVAHTSDVRAAGFASADIAGAVIDGLLTRVRRSWLVTPDCDERRRLAASVGGRLTCVSAAEVRGLWIPPSAVDDEGATKRSVHVAVPGNSSRHSASQLRLHWGTGPAPVSRNANEDQILNVLFHTAQCLPRRDALAIWESAINAKVADAAVLRRVAWRRADASAIAEVASALSD